ARVTTGELAAVEARERDVLRRRTGRLRGDRPAVDLAGRTALIVDDGIATGSTARAACQVVRAEGAARVILAAPVAPRSVINALREVADDVVVLESPEPFFAIGEFYDDFTPTPDGEVVRLLNLR